MTNIIFCADDFGLTPNINKSIIELIADGKIGATSVMYNNRMSSDIRKLREFPNLKIGLHFFLTTLPLFTHKNIKLDSPSSIYLNIIKDGFDFILKEFQFQLNNLENEIGRKVDYIDGHHYILSFPIISAAIFSYAQKNLKDYTFKLPFSDHPKNAKEQINSFLSKQIFKKHSNLNFIDGLIGVHDFDILPFEVFKEELKNILPNKTYHFSTHPCEDPSDINGIDSLLEFRFLDYKFLKDLQFSEYDIIFNK